MSDARAAEIAGAQFNRLTRAQLRGVGLSDGAIDLRAATGRLILVGHGVFAFAPVLDHDSWGRWMAAALTHPEHAISHLSSAVARELLSFEGPLIAVTRPGCGGPERHGGLLVHRSETLAGDLDEIRGIPITSAARTLIDIAPIVSPRALARAVREAVRLKQITLLGLGDAMGRFRGRRGIRKLAGTVARYSGIPIERARSGAEVRAMELLRDAGVPLPRLNVNVARVEADLSWPARRLIIEIDGDPFHLDKGEDERKENIWRGAGWTVERIPSDDVYDRPWRLVELARSE